MVAGGLCLISGMANAGTATTTFTVNMTIVDQCILTSGGTSNLNFGSVGVIAANIDLTNQITVQCTTGTTYKIGLDAGTATGATTTTRQMTNGVSGTHVNYQLFSDAGRTTNWGNGFADQVSGTGTGSAIVQTVYGRVPFQPTPSAGTYLDTITVTVSY
jgi:spore coat protein U-like protein